MMAQQQLLSVCAFCNTGISPEDRVKHHISYFPEITIDLHNSCHTKLHRNTNISHFLKSLLPPPGHASKFYTHAKRCVWKHPRLRIIEPCTLCGRILIARSNEQMDANMERHQCSQNCKATSQ